MARKDKGHKLDRARGWQARAALARKRQGAHAVSKKSKTARAPRNVNRVLSNGVRKLETAIARLQRSGRRDGVDELVRLYGELSKRGRRQLSTFAKALVQTKA